MTQMTVTDRKRLEGGGSQWGFKDGMVRLQLWTLSEAGEPSRDPVSVWMSPGQAMELIEQGARATRLALKGLTHEGPNTYHTD